jgi:hypothetical protein
MYPSRDIVKPNSATAISYKPRMPFEHSRVSRGYFASASALPRSARAMARPEHNPGM